MLIDVQQLFISKRAALTAYLDNVPPVVDERIVPHCHPDVLSVCEVEKRLAQLSSPNAGALQAHAYCQMERKKVR